MNKEYLNRKYRRTFFKNTKPKNRKRTKGRKIQIIEVRKIGKNTLSTGYPWGINQARSVTKKIIHRRFSF